MPSTPPPKRPPCAVHGLAAGPDGLCALCRRAAAAKNTPLPVAVAGDGLGSGFVTRLLGIGLMLSLVGMGAYAFNAWSSTMAGSNAALVAEPPGRGLPARQAAKPKPLEATGGSAGSAQNPLAQANDGPANTVLTAEEIERRRLRDLETAEQDRRRSAQIEADFAARAHKKARSNVSITMYSTSWCPSCKAARQYLTDEGILFVEHDIDESASARAIMKRLNPDGSVPTIDIDGAVLVGFSGGEIEDAIDTAAKKRSGG